MATRGSIAEKEQAVGMQGCTAPAPVPRLDPAVYPIADDQEFISELLQEEKVLLVQGSGFNWPHPDHFRLVFLPHEDDLREAINRVARFLETYRRRHGTA